MRREGESFVRYSSIDIDTFIEGHIQGEDIEEERNPKVKNIKVSPGVATRIRNRLWMNAVSVAINMYDVIKL